MYALSGIAALTSLISAKPNRYGANNHEAVLSRPLAYSLCDLCRVIRLGKETAPLRKVLFAYPTMSRGHNYPDGRPAVAHGMNEFETVYGTWHLNIRKSLSGNIKRDYKVFGA